MNELSNIEEVIYADGQIEGHLYHWGSPDFNGIAALNYLWDWT